MIVRGGPNGCAAAPGVVVRLVARPAGGRSVAFPSRLRAAATSSVPQPVSESRPAGQAAQPLAGVRVGRGALEQPLDLAGGQARVLAEQQRRGSRSPAARRTRCRSRPGTRTARRSSTATPVQPAIDASTRLRGIVEKIGPPGAAMSTKRRVAIRVVGDRAGLADGADAEHVRQRGGIVGVLPGRPRRLRPVADRRDDERALRVRVLDGLLLVGREGVELGVERVADAADAQVDHARAVVRRPSRCPGSRPGSRRCSPT